VELREIDAAPPPQPPPEPAKPPATRKRKTTPARAALPAGPATSATAAVAEPPPPPVAPVPEEPDPGAAPPPSRGELRKLHAALRDLQITGRAEGLALVSAWAGRTVESTSDLNGAEVATVLDRLDALRAIAAQDRAGEEPQDEDGDEDQAVDFEPPDDP
jgi:hypothetical protein